ncbi:MAG: hypothetical protein A2Y09_06610 [Planctomycetes bacterium GWA2_39_15]|nr:MAG: hypothetical protein A2Y09_06610 [Planctomycetes bacterium GWA2_39_15]OHB41500.1 MAG: hypothetical protein A2Y11_01210 [Planctomycetes bacterium GWC2_39_26]
MNKHIVTYTNQISEYAFIAYFFIHSFFPFGAEIIKLLCLLTMIGCWTTRIKIEKKVLFNKTSIDIPILSYLLCSIVASLLSANIKSNLETVFHEYFQYFIIFFCMVNTIHGTEQIKRIVKAMLITCGLVCAYGLYGYYTGLAINAGRLVATFEYHSKMARYISLLLPITVCLFFWYKNILTRLSLAFLVSLCSFSLILTMNRASWVAILVSMFFIGFAFKKQWLIFIFVGLCTLCFFILPSKFITRAKTIVQVNKYFNSEEILGERMLCWKASIAMIREHPSFGIGPSSRVFRNAYQEYGKKIRDVEKQMKNEAIPAQPEKEKKKKGKNKVKKLDKLSNAHNILLSICVGTGIVGLLLFLWLFINVFYTAIKSWRFSVTGYERTLLIGITASLISIFSHGFTDYFWGKPDTVFLWYIIGILFVLTRSTPNHDQTSSLQKRS